MFLFLCVWGQQNPLFWRLRLRSLAIYTPGIYADGVYSFRLSVRPFISSLVRLLVRSLVGSFVTFCVKVLVKVSLVVYISYTNGQKYTTISYLPV